MSHAKVTRFQTSHHIVTLRGDTSIIEYQWEMAWTTTDGDHAEKGREVLVLARRDEGWRVVWRTQIPTDSE